jgi:hypothetical protein
MKVTDWTKIELESAKFIFSEAEKVLDDGIRTAEQITTRALNILNFLIPLIILLLSYLALYFNIAGVLTQISIAGLILGIILVFMCLRVYDIYEIIPMGNWPENLLKDEYINNDYQELLYYYNASLTAQNAIKTNKQNNTERSNQIDSILRLIRLGLVFIVSYFLIFTALSPFSLAEGAAEEVAKVAVSFAVALVVALLAVFVNR